MHDKCVTAMLIFPVEKSSQSSDFEKSSLKSCYFYESDSDCSDSDDSDSDDSDFDESTGNDWPDPVFLSDQSDPLIRPNQSESDDSYPSVFEAEKSRKPFATTVTTIQNALRWQRISMLRAPSEQILTSFTLTINGFYTSQKCLDQEITLLMAQWVDMKVEKITHRAHVGA